MKKTTDCKICNKKGCKSRLKKSKGIFYYKTDCGQEYTIKEMDDTNLKIFNKKTRKRK